MFKPGYGGITLKLVVLVAVASSLPLSIMGGVTYFSMKNNLEQNLQETLVNAGDEMRFLVDEFLKGRQQESHLIASALRETQAPERFMQQALTDTDYFDWLGLLDEHGNVYAQAGDMRPTPLAENEREARRSWSEAFSAGHNVVDVSAESDSAASRYVMLLTEVDDRFLAAQMPLEHVVALVDRVQIGETGRATLFNGDGMLIGHVDESRFGYDMSHYPIMQAPVERGVGDPGAEFLSGDGRMKFGMTAVLPWLEENTGVRWGLIVDQTLSELYAPVDRLNWILWSLWFIALGITLMIGFVYAKVLVAPLKKLARALEDIATGEADLTQRIHVKSRDEIGSTADSFNHLMETFHDLISEISSAVAELAASSSQLDQSTTATYKSLNQQQGEVDQVASAMDEMSATVHEVAQNTSEASRAAEASDHASDEGQSIVEQTLNDIRSLADDIKVSSEVIHKLETDAGDVGSILDVIGEIADQTNLLALNAAIEAARAGEHGRGFAVVADEVRTLAQRTQEATGQIRSMIENFQKSSRQAVQTMQTNQDKAEQTVAQAQKTGTALTRINEAVASINDMNAQIATAAEEQSAVADEVSKNIHRISELSHATEAQASDSSDAGQRLRDLATQLQSRIGRFKL